MRSAIFVAAGLIALAGPVSAARAAEACSLDHAPTDRWSLRREAGTAWLVTPCGDEFFSTGVNVVDGGAPARQARDRIWYSWPAFQPSLEAWIDETRGRLRSWGLNSAGGWSLPPAQLRLPEIADLELGRNSRFHWFDPFNPATEQAMMAAAPGLVAPYKGSPYRIGYFSDNEVGWWTGALFHFYSQKPADNVTKQRWVAFLRERYHENWGQFTKDFAPPSDVSDWKGLLATIGATHLRPGSDGVRAVRGWAALVAERYYALSAKAIHAADPNALYFGDRLPIYYDPVAVRAEGRHVDAIATNYNVDSDDGWVARYYFDALHQLSGGKPVLVSEWFFAARENRTGNINNGHLMTVDTQLQRANGARAATAQFARIPDLVGLHWFQYYDHPKGGRGDGEDYNFGLVDINNQPYETLTSAIAPQNAALPRLHAAGDAGAPLRQPDRHHFTIPYADIDVGDRSLRDWPKQAALLPTLIASPGEVPFGEAYLAWSAKGLALASIGQDYFDIDLMPYEGSFPLTEAFRVELGVDAGTGPRQFTLYFIPPKTKVKDHPPMTAMLCAGPAVAVGSPNPVCTPVPGAQASYFGADQPRITSETLLPWSALGLNGPPANGQVKVELSSTAWYRSRWMSLSGQAPRPGLPADTKHWLLLRLGTMS